MRDAVKTIGNLIDKQNVSFISSVDENGYPNTKATKDFSGALCCSAPWRYWRTVFTRR